MILLLLYLTLALTVSFLCSILESVLLTTPLSHTKLMEDKGAKWAPRLMRFKQEIDRPLSAILSMNTVAHTVGAAGVGAQAVSVFGEAYFGVISAVLTLLILVFTEIIPKTIGALYWKGLGAFTAYTIQLFIVISYPLVYLSAFITRSITNGKKEQYTSREEIAFLAVLGESEGVITDTEARVVQNILGLKKLKITEVMTPRVVVQTAHIDLDPQAFLQEDKFQSYSRIPVFKDGEEEIIGYLYRPDVLEGLASGKPVHSLEPYLRSILIFPKQASLLLVWEQMLERKEHIALIVDEYGGVEGIITMEDIIESLLGLEIVDERDTVVDLQHYARNRWYKRNNRS
ncbi:MAG: hemolysin family protein [Bacteroidetes bacterium]|nr:hemolysin family protein [Bacteroidota bacterium]